MTDYVLGVDLNDYRKGVPLKTFKQQGGRFVINKATEGTSLVHETLEIYRAEAASKNLPFGAYIYWRFIYDAAEQAEYYCEKLGKVQLPPIVDVERYFNRNSNGSPIVSVQANKNHLKVVLDTIENKLNFKPMIYTNWATWNEQFGNWDLIKDYDLWVANYGRPSPWLPEPAENWVLWQFTNAYYIDGYSRGVDGNYFNGNEGEFEAQLQSWDEIWNPPPPPPPPPPSENTFVSGSILRVNGDEELFVLSEGDEIRLKVEKI